MHQWRLKIFHKQRKVKDFDTPVVHMDVMELTIVDDIPLDWRTMLNLATPDLFNLNLYPERLILASIQIHVLDVMEVVWIAHWGYIYRDELEEAIAGPKPGKAEYGNGIRAEHFKVARYNGMVIFSNTIGERCDDCSDKETENHHWFSTVYKILEPALIPTARHGGDIGAWTEIREV